MGQDIPKVEEAHGFLERQSETTNAREPLLDQHISLMVDNSLWVLPLGVFAVALRFNEPITEYVDLVFSLVKNISTSILGNSIN